MANRPWLDDVAERLARHGLPPTYVQRFVAELADHFHDLKEETMGAEDDLNSRLGEPEQVAEAAVVAYRRRSFLGRHPTAALLVFAISPILAQSVLLLFGVAGLFTLSGQRTFDWYEHHWGLSLFIVVCSILLSVLYGEQAMRLGLGRKWMLASCMVLGVIAMFWESCFGQYAGTGIVMLPLQFAVPLGAGWSFPKLKRSYRDSATRFLVFAMSPVLSYMLLSYIIPLLVSIALLACAHFGSSAATALSVLMFVVPTVVLSILCYHFAKQFRSGKRWAFVSAMVLAMLPMMPFMPLLLLYLVPTIVASLLYCKLAARSGVGGKWMLVSCMVLAACETACFLQGLPRMAYDGPGRPLWPISVMCIGLVQFLVPLAIGWMFLRREHHRGQLQMAS